MEPRPVSKRTSRPSVPPTPLAPPERGRWVRLRVLKIEANVTPWRAVGCRGAKAVIELASGECSRRKVAVGDELAFA